MLADHHGGVQLGALLEAELLVQGVAVAVALHAQELRAARVAARHHEALAVDPHRGRDGDVGEQGLVPPAELAGARVEGADEHGGGAVLAPALLGAGEEEEQLLPEELHQDRLGLAGPEAVGAPRDLSRVLVQRHEAHGLAQGGEDHQVAVQDRIGGVPEVGHLAAEVVLEVAPPPGLVGPSVHAVDTPEAAAEEDRAVADRGRRAGASGLQAAGLRVGEGPSRGPVQDAHDPQGVAHADLPVQHEGEAIPHRRAAVARLQGHAPGRAEVGPGAPVLGGQVLVLHVVRLRRRQELEDLPPMGPGEHGPHGEEQREDQERASTEHGAASQVHPARRPW